MFNHLLGVYIGYAINNPKKYPKNPFFEKEMEDNNRIMSDDEMERQARLNTIKKGGVIND